MKRGILLLLSAITIRFYSTVMFLCCFCKLQAQNINGTWKGVSYYPGETEDTSKIYFQIEPKHITSHYSGTCLTTGMDRGEPFYGKASISGSYNKRTKKYGFTETALTDSSGFLFLDRYVLWFIPGQKDSLKGWIVCKDYVRLRSALCDVKRVIILSRTTEPPPEKTTYRVKTNRAPNDTIWINTNNH
jgi:hypothetical protein